MGHFHILIEFISFTLNFNLEVQLFRLWFWLNLLDSKKRQ